MTETRTHIEQFNLVEAMFLELEGWYSTQAASEQTRGEVKSSLGFLALSFPPYDGDPAAHSRATAPMRMKELHNLAHWGLEEAEFYANHGVQTVDTIFSSSHNRSQGGKQTKRTYYFPILPLRTGNTPLTVQTLKVEDHIRTESQYTIILTLGSEKVMIRSDIGQTQILLFDNRLGTYVQAPDTYTLEAIDSMLTYARKAHKFLHADYLWQAQSVAGGEEYQCHSFAPGLLFYNYARRAYNLASQPTVEERENWQYAVLNATLNHSPDRCLQAAIKLGLNINALLISPRDNGGTQLLQKAALTVANVTKGSGGLPYESAKRYMNGNVLIRALVVLIPQVTERRPGADGPVLVPTSTNPFRQALLRSPRPFTSLFNTNQTLLTRASVLDQIAIIAITRYDVRQLASDAVGIPYRHPVFVNGFEPWYIGRDYRDMTESDLLYLIEAGRK